MDRMGASANFGLNSIKKKLNINAELLQIPIGEDSTFCGVVDLIKMKAIYFEG